METDIKMAIMTDRQDLLMSIWIKKKSICDNKILRTLTHMWCDTGTNAHTRLLEMLHTHYACPYNLHTIKQTHPHSDSHIVFFSLILAVEENKNVVLLPTSETEGESHTHSI